MSHFVALEPIGDWWSTVLTRSVQKEQALSVIAKVQESMASLNALRDELGLIARLAVSAADKASVAELFIKCERADKILKGVKLIMEAVIL